MTYSSFFLSVIILSLQSVNLLSQNLVINGGLEDSIITPYNLQCNTCRGFTIFFDSRKIENVNWDRNNLSLKDGAYEGKGYARLLLHKTEGIKRKILHPEGDLCFLIDDTLKTLINEDSIHTLKFSCMIRLPDRSRYTISELNLSEVSFPAPGSPYQYFNLHLRFFGDSISYDTLILASRVWKMPSFKEPKYLRPGKWYRVVLIFVQHGFLLPDGLCFGETFHATGSATLKRNNWFSKPLFSKWERDVYIDIDDVSLELLK